MKPKIRLKGFHGEWIESAFSESFDSLKNNSLSRAELSDNGSVYNIHYGDVLITYNECVEIDKNVKTYVKDSEVARKLHLSCAIKNGDIIFADAAEDNTVGKCTEVIAQESDEIVSGLHTIPCRPKKKFASLYLGYYLNSKAYHDQLLPHIQGTKISSISKRALSQTHIRYPSDKNEQQAIASYFQHLVSLIQSTTKKIESLKQVKAASLQAMFPQVGGTTPRLRFKGFEGEWEKGFLGSLFSERNESNINAEMLSVTMNQGVIKASQNGRHDNSNEDKSHYKLVKKGDIAYNSMRMWQGASGYSPYEGIVSPAYTVISPAEDVCSRFFAYMFKTPGLINRFRLHSQGLTSDTWNLKYPAFSKIEVLFPPNKNEQEQIVSYFTSLDMQIHHHIQRLEKLKQIKGACLDNMFV